jgi:hypothetical protein
LSDEKKFILCPSCGAILEKGIVYCSYCGANVKEKKEDDFYQKPVQEPTAIPLGRQPNPQYRRGFGSQTIQQDQTVFSEGEMESRLKAEDKIQKATIYSYLALCIPFLGVVFLGIVIVLAMQVRKILGRGDVRLQRAVTTAIFGAVIDVVNLFFLLNFFGIFNWF